MMSEHWTDRLSEYMDGELDGRDTAALEEHVALCTACRSTLEELRAVVEAAESLEDRPPAIDLLPGILERIGSDDDVSVTPIGAWPGRRRRFTFSTVQLAAAATVLMTISAGSAWLMTRSPVSPAAVATAEPVAEPTESADLVAQFVFATEQNYEGSITELEAALAEVRPTLDRETVRVIEESLATIDAAIAEARAALENDPSSRYLYRHLDNTMSKKVELLRRATSPRST